MSLRHNRPARALALIAALSCAPLAAASSPTPSPAASAPSVSRPAVLPPVPVAVSPGDPATPGVGRAAPTGQAQAGASIATTPRASTTRSAGGVGGERRPPSRRRAALGPTLARPLAALQRANAVARDGPSSGVFVNSALYHAFEPGRLYAIHTSPRFLTTIALRPGEKLIAKAAGDTVRWVLGETESGAGEAQQVIVLVKPMRSGLRTNLVLTTDQRTYLIDAVSTDSGAYTSVLSWTYPQEEARERAAEAARRAAAAEQMAAVQSAVPVERLDFRYAITPLKGRAPAWTPVRVFDDGAKTYIEFPPDLAVREAPPVFLLDADDQAQLVNSRLAGRYLVVDRVIDRAELRLGDKKPVIVRLTRQGDRP
ncbi:P-type conjugative transfer protein TrbG [Caulobacter segnis]|uniref:P-type conjugative transfer protein TrbG n=1 Tax=Caulobacter segnis TaxID=88688 RepID=A0A2W5V9Y7_9CAUL|nr:P-type conjugative transfer protein TrbG [Caulobacter segnis]PZR35477.1 MAG: P-type conjugative transfer protein TrbG [Caulobacter segnis]